MVDALQAADEIYNAALQILSAHQVDAKAVPLVMGAVAQRLDSFALGAIAHELAASQPKEAEHADSEEG